MGGEQGVGICASMGFVRSCTMRVMPCARAQQRESRAPGLGFAGFERNTGPAELPPQAYDAPVVRAFVHEEGFARGDAVYVEGVVG